MRKLNALDTHILGQASILSLISFKSYEADLRILYVCVYEGINNNSDYPGTYHPIRTRELPIACIYLSDPRLFSNYFNLYLLLPCLR